MLRHALTGYMIFGLGVVFGTVVATLTTYYIFEAARGDVGTQEFLQIRQCIEERFDE